MKRLILILILTLSSIPYAFSQISFSIGPTAGYFGPSGDYSGNAIDYYNGTKYGLKGGMSFGAMARIKILMLSGKASVSYSSLSNSGTTGNGGNIDLSQSIVTIGIGPELNLGIPLIPVRPYLGIDLLFTNFSGEVTFRNVPDIPDGTYKMSSASRTGLGLGAGVNLGISKKLSIDLNLRYNFHNLFGKDFTLGTTRTNSYMSLNDASDPNNSADPLNHPISGNRSIQSIQLNVGILFDF